MLSTVYSCKFIIDEIKLSPFKSSMEKLTSKCLEDGYVAVRLRHRCTGIIKFIRWAAANSITPKNISKDHVLKFMSLFSARVPTARVSGLCYFTRKFFKVVEQDTGKILLEYHASDIHPNITLHTNEYSIYLKEVRGLSSLSIPRMTSILKVFLAWKYKNDKLNFKNLGAKDILNYLHWRAKSRSLKTLQTEAAGLKTYFRYLFGQAIINVDFSHAVPKIAGWRNQNHVDTLSEEEVNRLLSCIEQSTAQGIREFTIILLIVQYGLRAIEVARLKLSDVDWCRKIITIHGKGNKFSELPLTQNIEFALKRYLDHSRPFSKKDAFFLTTLAPVKEIDPKAGVSCIVGRAMKKAGIKKKVIGAQILRSTTASRVLNNGGTLKEAKELLRHSHIDTTSSRYTRVDFNRLQAVSLPWIK